MKNITRIFTFLAASALAFGQQNVLTQTTLSSAVTAGQTSVVVASATNIAVTSGTTNGAVLYVVDAGEAAGELMRVTSVSSTTIGVQRGMGGTPATSHAATAMVLVGQPQWFKSKDSQGSCVTASTLARPAVNANNGLEWLCSTVTLTWVPGWGNTTAPPAVTTAVASAAGAITPSGPLFHVTGTAAVTGFNIPVGFYSGCFAVIPDGVFTWTTAGNIALAGTAVVNKQLTFCWDHTNSKWVPSYIA